MANDPYYAQRFDPIIQAFQTINGRPPTTAELMSLTNNDSNTLTQNQVAATQLLASSPQGRNTSVTLPSGIGSDAQVNQANQYLRAQPFYQQALQWMGQGQNGSNVNLSPSQRDTLLQEIKNAGINVSDHFEIDQAGNIHPKSSIGKDILAAVAIGGVALTGLGLAGIGPLAGALSGATGAATGASEMAVTSTGVPAIAEGTSLGIGGLAAPAAAATGAAAGAAATLPEMALSSSGVPAVPLASDVGITSAVPAGLPSTAVGTGLATTPAGAATSMSGDIGAAATAGSQAGASTLQKISGLLSSAGQGVGAATTAAGNNALDQEKLALDANQQNISGQSAFVNELLNMANTEASQRKSALGDVYRSSMASHPRVSPFDPVGAPVFSDQYKTTATNLGDQGAALLSSAPKYDVAGMPTPTYAPIDIKNVQGATNTQPGTMQKIGEWLSPALTIGGKVASLFG